MEVDEDGSKAGGLRVCVRHHRPGEMGSIGEGIAPLNLENEAFATNGLESLGKRPNEL